MTGLSVVEGDVSEKKFREEKVLSFPHTHSGGEVLLNTKLFEQITAVLLLTGSNINSERSLRLFCVVINFENSEKSCFQISVSSCIA